MLYHITDNLLNILHDRSVFWIGLTLTEVVNYRELLPLDTNHYRQLSPSGKTYLYTYEDGVVTFNGLETGEFSDKLLERALKSNQLNAVEVTDHNTRYPIFHIERDVSMSNKELFGRLTLVTLQAIAVIDIIDQQAFSLTTLTRDSNITLALQLYVKTFFSDSKTIDSSVEDIRILNNSSFDRITLECSSTGYRLRDTCSMDFFQALMNVFFSYWISHKRPLLSDLDKNVCLNNVVCLNESFIYEARLIGLAEDIDYSTHMEDMFRNFLTFLNYTYSIRFKTPFSFP